MNNIKLTLVILLTTLYSCSDDILDNTGAAGESQPTQFITNAQLDDAALENPGVPAALINGIYAQMIDVGSGGSASQQDFGHKSYHIYTDMMSGDMALSQSNFGWYRAGITELQTPVDFTRGENRHGWRYYYRIVRSANNVIQNLGGNDVTPESEDDKYSMGQAKAMRAHSYFYLTQLYQKEYNATEPILPLYILPETENKAKSTASEVYDQIEKDLNEAIILLEGFNPSSKNQVDKAIAQVMLAYVLGARQTDYIQMAALTQDVINTSGHTILARTDLTNGFNDTSNNSWMWGIDIVVDNGLGLISWWGQIDAYSFSYGWAGDYKTMDQTLFNSMDATDGRREQFFDDSTNGRHLQPLGKFYWTDGLLGTTSFGSGPNPGVTADYVYMRIEEAYLLNAEANARSGNETTAKMSLKSLMDNRVDDSSYIDALSGQALLDEIYLQTRIELWGEGKSYFAMKRNKATIIRSDNHLSLVGEPIMYNDERLTFEIPQLEIQNNPFVNDQNQ